MKSGEALRALAELSTSQWGIVTTAQAAERGVKRLDLSRLTEAGQLVRLAHGVYRDAGAPSDEFEDLRAAWLSTEPTRLAESRLADGASGVVVTGASAASLHGIGDLSADRHEFNSPTRRQSQRSEIHYRQRHFGDGEVTIVAGLPVTTIERTIADLVEAQVDLSLVADVLRDATRKSRVDLAKLESLLSPLAARQGFRKDDGRALLDRLLEISGLDAETLARSIAAASSFGALVSANYLNNMQTIDLGKMIISPELSKSIQDALRPHLKVSASTQAAFDSIIKNAGLDRMLQDSVAKSMAQLVATDAFRGISKDWTASILPKLDLAALQLAAQERSQNG